ncbi:MAG: cupin domain-containing protein [Candidatus Odyssella sp.]|nr:cupin domain-containing protein [Candidatus Odyssella sp.]
MQIEIGRAWRGFVAVTALAGSFALAGNALAGECPAGQTKADVTKNAGHAAKAVTDTVLAQIDLGAEKVALKGHNMRVRKLVIQPGGIVPWHSHAERPALIYIVSGQVFEYASNCAVPILHKAGEVARETHATAHWWKNTGNVPVVLLSFDIQRDPNDKNM